MTCSAFICLISVGIEVDFAFGGSVEFGLRREFQEVELPLFQRRPKGAKECSNIAPLREMREVGSHDRKATVASV